MSTNPTPPRGVAIADWDDLFSAVKARLKLTVDEWVTASAAVDPKGAAARVREGVLECAGALDQLHATLAHEAERRQRLELEVFDTQVALAQARAELAETRAAEQRALHTGSHDALTLLPARGFFRDRLQHVLARAEPRPQAVTLLYLDLDGLKPINEVHGHDTGDELLRIVAARLARTVRSDAIVGRLGSDEFAFLLTEVPSRERLSHLACSLLEVVSAPLKIGELELRVRPSIGIATYPTDGATAEALLKTADAARHLAKQSRTGYAFFDERAEPRVTSETTLDH
jgi:diguanylate cyclase (GGDEF)-like protein